MATAQAKARGRATLATKKTPSTTAPIKGARTSMWRYQVACNGASPSEGPVTHAEMLRQVKALTTNMSVAKNGKARITIDCTTAGAKTAPMH